MPYGSRTLWNCLGFMGAAFLELKSLDVSKAIDKMGGKVPWAEFAPVFAQAVLSAGLTYTAVDRHLGVEAPGASSCYWARTDHRGGLPARHHWERLCELLPDLLPQEGLYEAAEREVIGLRTRSGAPPQPMWGDDDGQAWDETVPATSEAKRWQGWGSAMKPANEPIVVARKPLTGTLARNVLAYGTGALNIDGCRIGTDWATDPTRRGWQGRKVPRANSVFGADPRIPADTVQPHDAGRWPANLVLSHDERCEQVGVKRVRSQNPAYVSEAKGQPGYHGGGGGRASGVGIGHADDDGTEAVEDWVCVEGCPVRMLDEQSGERRSSGHYNKGSREVGDKAGPASIPIDGHTSSSFADKGGASRFFLTTPSGQMDEIVEKGSEARFRYVAKASRGERDAGLEGFAVSGEIGTTGRGLGNTLARCVEHDAPLPSGTSFYTCGCKMQFSAEQSERRDPRANTHPTVKPIALMRWLVRLVTPPGGRILDPFLGSGSTGCAAALEGFDFVGVEQDEGYVELARARIVFWEGRAAAGDRSGVVPKSAKAVKPKPVSAGTAEPDTHEQFTFDDLTS